MRIVKEIMECTSRRSGIGRLSIFMPSQPRSRTGLVMVDS